MIKNGKYFVRPEGDGGDFKALFKRLASSGAGRPADRDGFPQGPWTPDLLAEAISQIAANRSGVELRTVQLWFQDNEKGISSDNIRWLARVFGCDDPEATSEWQAELSASQSRLVAKRRQKRQSAGSSAEAAPSSPRTAAFENGTATPAEAAQRKATEEANGRTSLARKSEALFGRGSPLDLPASVFAGAVALGFFSYFLGIHSLTHVREDGVAKQVGFLWAPNWTFLFMVFMPLYFAFVTELLVVWKNEGRSKLLTKSGILERGDAWTHKVEASAYTYWAVLLICLVFAGIFQWISVRLIPLLEGAGDYAIDWGSLAIINPNAVSVSQTIAFTGFAYLYMCICFYLYFAGLILLYTIVHDYWEIGKSSEPHAMTEGESKADEPGLRIMRGVFRSAVSGLLIAFCMKLQAFYVTTNAESVWHWLLSDSMVVLVGSDQVADRGNFSMPTHYTSLLVVIATCVVFLYAFIRVGLGSRFFAPSVRMAVAVALLVGAYLLIGAFIGFSILLGLGVLLAIYGLFDPGLGTRRLRELEEDQGVP